MCRSGKRSFFPDPGDFTFFRQVDIVLDHFTAQSTGGNAQYGASAVGSFDFAAGILEDAAQVAAD